MKTKILITTVIAMLGLFNAKAQSRSEKKEVVVVVNEKTGAITHFEEYTNLRNAKNARKKYPNSKFYSGLIGSQDEKSLGPLIGTAIGKTPVGTLITIHTNEALFSEDRLGNFDKMGSLKQGDIVQVGNSHAKVISSKLQVEMTLQVF